MAKKDVPSETGIHEEYALPFRLKRARSKKKKKKHWQKTDTTDSD